MRYYIMSSNSIIQCPVCRLNFITREERKEHFEFQHVVG
jgi:hypothetical protein